ncbi:MAG TPA: hypothetical protein VL860_07240 [Planctomycetota bacterium]|nr:hypothetical protein [Planctomycetota bacterium]
MKPVLLEQIPDSGRLWVFHSASPFSPAQQQSLTAGLAGIVEQWQSHGAEVRAGFELRYDRFVLVAADESAAPLAGCSMDSLRDSVTQLGCTLGLELLDGPPVIWREGSAIRSGTRPEFKERIQTGAVTADTLVFDMTLERVGDLRAGRWERPFRESWHAKAFRLPPGVGAPARAI